MTKPMHKQKPSATALRSRKNGLPDWSGLTSAARRRAIKAYFDTLSPEEEERQLSKLSGADLHSLMWDTVHENAQAGRRLE